MIGSTETAGTVGTFPSLDNDMVNRARIFDLKQP